MLSEMMNWNEFRESVIWHDSVNVVLFPNQAQIRKVFQQYQTYNLLQHKFGLVNALNLIRDSKMQMIFENKERVSF